jgi:N-terminal domain of reverse transcriptase
MTADQNAAGAASHAEEGWHSINWRSACRIVCRLQARIVKAIQAGRWGKAKALQYLLTHSFSGKALAVRRVTEHQGKGTPGVDREVWDTPEEEATAVQAPRQRGYHPQPLRRVYIPENNGKMRALGIPICRSYCTSSQGGWGFWGPEPDPHDPRSLRSRTVATNGAAPAGAARRSPRLSVGSTRDRVAPLECCPGDPIGTRRRWSRYSHSTARPLPAPYTARPRESHLDRQPAHQGSHL